MGTMSHKCERYESGWSRCGKKKRKSSYEVCMNRNKGQKQKQKTEFGSDFILKTKSNFDIWPFVVCVPCKNQNLNQILFLFLFLSLWQIGRASCRERV